MRFSVGSVADSGGLRSRLATMLEAAATAILVLLALTASAMGEGAKPFRAARLTYLQGQMRVEQANSTANSVAVVNMPLVEGTVISTGADGEAEIEFEDGSLARLTPNSGVSLLNLSVDSSGTYQTRIAVLGGLAYFELRAGTKYIYSVDAGGDVISPVENATIRVNFDEAPAAIAVLDGSAHVAGAGGANADASAGQTVRNEAGPEAGSQEAMYTVKQAIAPESWDRWNEDRDEAAASGAESQTDVRGKFAGSQGYGWADLDANGSWYDVPGQGPVWQPDIAANADDAGAADADAGGFDPYGYGSWAWTPAGYSWASGYGWGWLPYRCGQWAFYDGFGWGWSPSLYCGVYGFGGYGYGVYGFNFGNLPPGYKRPRRPVPGPGPIHPILRGRGGRVPPEPVHRPGGERVIAGVTVQPVQPTGLGFVSGSVTGGALGAALRRDYPVDAKSREPVLGVVAAHGALTAGSSPRAGYSPRPVYGGPVYAAPVYAAPGRPAPGGVGNLPTREQYKPGTVPSSGGSRPAPVYRQGQAAPVQRQAPEYSPRPSAPSAPASHASSSSAPSSSKGK